MNLMKDLIINDQACAKLMWCAHVALFYVGNLKIEIAKASAMQYDTGNCKYATCARALNEMRIKVWRTRFFMEHRFR